MQSANSTSTSHGQPLDIRMPTQAAGGLLAIAAVAQCRTLSVTQLMDYVPVQERAARRLVRGLETVGYLERVTYLDQRRPYRLGPVAFELGQLLHAAAVARIADEPAPRYLDLGERLRAYRLLRGLTQVAAAELFGLERGANELSEVERGLTPIDLATLQRMAEWAGEDPLVILNARL